MENHENVVIMSADYSKAVKLTQHIKAHAEMAQQSLYEVCKGLKEMRDGKLYKELGYQNFENYCENEVGFTRRQAYNYISVASNLPEDFVNSGSQIGIRKLSLLAKLDEPERQEIQQTTDLESTTVKELKAKIRNLKQENQVYQEESDSLKAKVRELHAESIKLEVQVRERDEEIEAARMMYDELKDEKNELFEENVSLGEQLDELRSQGEPVIDATYTDNSEEVERLTVRNEELETEIQNLRAEHIKELAQVRTESRKPVTIPDYTDSYRILIQNAKEPIARLKTFMKEHPEIAGSGYDFFHQVFLTLANMESKLNKG